MKRVFESFFSRPRATLSGDMAERGTDSEEASHSFTVRVIPPESRRAAVDFLLATYGRDPEFRSAFHLESDADVLGFEQEFVSMCDPKHHVKDSVLGCFDGPRLVGVLAYGVTGGKVSVMTWLRYPQLYARAQYLRLRNRLLYGRSRMRSAATRDTWKTYVEQLRGQRPDDTRLVVLALAVDERLRQRGVARLLIDTMERSAQHRRACSVVETNTWTPAKVKIYERLGFEVFAHSEREEITSWTLLRRIDASEAS